jgi:cellulose synthase (UDP-forming)
MDYRINPIQPPSAKEKNALRLMIFVGIVSMGFFLFTIFRENVISYFPLYVLLMATMIYYCLKYLHEWYHYFSISSNNKPDGTKRYTVDILTTYCAGEPFDMLKQTLEAIQNIKYPHTAWCCDEADDSNVRDLCLRLGVRHITRTDKKNAKAGNINNALQFATGELCVVLDPDHIPAPEFLNELVSYFDDSSIGFVQIVQAYYNQAETLVAKGAAQQTYQFYGPMMMTMHKYGTVQAIGANCTFRRKALDSIGGHANGLAEDMHTAMKLHASGWRSVYVPAILTRGLVPATMSSYYKQQLKWSRGTWELLVSVYPKLFTKFTRRQKIHYLTLPFHYLSGIIFFINFLIPVISLFTGYLPLQMDVLNFFLVAFPLFGMSTLIRHYVQKWVSEERERGFHIVGGILQIGAWWIHTLGFIYTILRKKVPYIPTPKNDSDRLPWLLNLPNILVGLISLAAIIYGLLENFNPYTIFMAGLASMQIAFMLFNLSISGYLSKTYRLNGIMVKLRENTWLVKKAHGFLRKYSLRLAFLLIVLFSLAYWKMQQLPDFLPKPLAGLQVFYRGIYQGAGLDIAKANSMLDEADKDGHLAIVSSEITWKSWDKNELDTNYLKEIYNHHSIPLVAWNLMQEQDINSVEVGQYFLEGRYDTVISSFATQLGSLDKPIFLRLANEQAGSNRSLFNSANYTPEDSKIVWQYLHTKFEEAGADKVIWVWNPPNAISAKDYFPGNKYVDWIGINVIDTSLNRLQTDLYSFDSLYRPYHSLQLFKSGVPVMLLNILPPDSNTSKWWSNTWTTIDTAFKEIRSVIVTAGNYKMLANSPRPSMPIDVPKITQKTYARAELRELPFPVKGVIYNKGYHWFRNKHTLGLKIIEKDIDAMKKIGINTIERIMPGIYDHDIDKALVSNKMHLIPRFPFVASPEVITDNKQMEAQKQKILRVIKNNLDKKYIAAWDLGEDVLHDLANQTYKPDYFYYQQKYITWLFDLCQNIRRLDSVRPIIMDLYWDINGRKQFNYYKKYVPQINTYMLETDARDTNILLEPLEKGMAWGQVEVNLWHFIPSIRQAGIIPAWQDVETTDYVKLNGLLDLMGRKKRWYQEALNIWGNKFAGVSPVPEIRILRPEELTVYNEKLVYYAIYKSGNSWKLYDYYNEKIHFEWYLVRLDQYGKTMFISKVGKGPYIELSIPRNPQYYNLYLEAVLGDNVKVAHTTLNTPFE